MADRRKILLPRSDIPGRAPTPQEIDFGEIAINTHDGKAYIKRQANGEVTIESIGAEAVDNVYYVSKSGDYGNDGRSLLNSFKTLDSAVAVVTAKQGFKFDEVTCERDLHLIMDAVRYDMLLDTNFNSVTAGLSYKRGNAAKVRDEQKYQTRRSINEERVGMISNPLVVANQTANDRIVAGFSEIIDIFYDGDPDALYYTAPPIEPQAGANAAAQAIQNNRTQIQDAVITYVNNAYIQPYNVEKCSRDVGLILDAVADDLTLGTNYNTITAGWAYKRANSAYVLSDQNEITVTAINVARNLVKGIGGVTSDATIDSLFLNVTQVIDGTQTVYPTPTYPTSPGSTYQTADRIAAATAIQTNRSDLVTALTTWIKTNKPEIFYDPAKCERDSGLIIDAVRRDLILGTDYNTITAAQSYLRANGAQYVLQDQGEKTIDTVEFIRDAVKALSGVTSYALIDTLFGRVINVLNLTTTTLTQPSFPTTAGATYQTGDRVSAASDLQTNRTDIINALTSWLATNFPAVTYDVAKCERDTGFIVDALTHDIKYGGNTAIRVNAQAYFEGTVNQLDPDGNDPDEITATIAAYQELKNIINTSTTESPTIVVITSAEQTRVTNLIDEIIGVLTAGNISGLAAEVEIDTSGLTTTEYDVITAAQSTLVADTVTYVNEKYPSYNVEKCERDTGYVLDALTHDIKYGGNGATLVNALSYYVGTVNQLGYNSFEIAATIAAYQQLGTFINDSYVTTNDEQGRIIFLLSIITDAVRDANFTTKEGIDVGGIATTERDLILAEKSSIQTQVIQYVDDNWAIKTTNIKSYDAGKCSRDVGLIIDAVARDLILGTNYNTKTAGWSYKRANSAYVLSDQNAATVGAVNFARDYINKLAGVTSDATITTLFANVTNVIEGVETTYPAISYPDTVGATYQTADRIAASAAIQANRSTIISDLTTWIGNEFLTVQYDEAKCSRDVGLILDAIRRDLILGTDYNSYTAAQAYLRANSAYVKSDQMTATIAGVEYARDKVKTLIGVTSDATIDTLVQRVIDVLDGSVVTFQEPLSFPTTSGSTYQTADRIAATDNIQANRATIVTELISWITANYPALTYNQANCERDTKFILDALTHDVKYGGNTATRTNALAYFVGATNQLDANGDSPDEVTASIAAFTELKNILTSSTTESPVVYVSTAAEQTRVDNLLDEIIGVLTAGEVTGLAAEAEIETGGLNTAEFDIIEANTSDIQTDTISYINAEYPVVVYDIPKCERDTGYILDALSHDVKYGGNTATITNAQSYFVGVVTQLGSEGEYTATSRAYEHLKSLVDTYVTTQPEQFRVSQLLDVIIEVIDDRSLDNLNDEEAIDTTGLTTTEYNLILSKKSLTQDAVIAYVDREWQPLYPDYDQVKCARDVGIILDAVKRDLITGSDYNTITAAFSYARANATYVLTNQNVKTLAGIRYARDQVKALAGVTSDATVDTLFARVTDVIEGYVTTYTTPSYPNNPLSTYQNSLSGGRITYSAYLQSARSSIVTAVVQYIDQQSQIVFDNDKCARDVGYVIDALSHDILYGGNTASRQNAISYFVGAVAQFGAQEKAITKQAYEYLRDQLATTYDNSAVQQIKDEIAAYVQIIIDYIDYDGSEDYLPAEVEIVTTGLTTTEFDAITEATLQIKDDTILFINDQFFNPVYDQAKCARDVGEIIDAISIGLRTQSDFPAEIIRLSYLRENAQEVYLKQRAATIAAVNYLENLITTAVSDPASDTLIADWFDTIRDGINQSDTSVLPYPDVAASPQTFATAERKAFPTFFVNNSGLVDDVVSYINVTLGLTDYDEAKCRRDTDIILKSIAFDTAVGGNWASTKAAESYYVGVISQLGNDAAEIAATVQAYQFIKDNTIDVQFAGQAAGLGITVSEAQIRADAKAAVDIIIAAINSDDVNTIPDPTFPSTVGIGATLLNVIDNQITPNRTIWQNTIIDFVNDSNPVSSFDDEKCARDTGLIIDAICIDLMTGSNYNSITAGLAYRRANAAKVESDQLDYTVQSINYLGDLLAGTSGITAAQVAFVRARIKEVTELLVNDTAFGKTDGTDIVYPVYSGTTRDEQNAVNAIRANKVNIIKKLTTWIFENFDTFEYDVDKCERDVGYLLDALAHDLLYQDISGNFAITTAAQSYWVGRDLNIEGNADQTQNLDGEADNYFIQLGRGFTNGRPTLGLQTDEVPVTSRAYQQLKAIVNDNITSDTEKSRVNALLQIIIDSIEEDSDTGPENIVPAVVNYSGIAATIQTDRSTTVDDVTLFANKIFPTFTYDQNKCRRDVGYILDALTYDLSYGGNSATSIAMRSYFSIFNNGYGDLLGDNEYTLTVAAYKNLKTILDGYFSQLSQGIRDTKNNLLDIIIKALQQTTAGTFQLGDFFNTPNRNQIYQYNYPTGLASGYDSQTFPDLIALGYKVVFNELYNVHTSFDVDTSQRLTIIRSSSAVARNQGTDTTIFLKSGDYVVNNPIKLPPKTSIIGDALRSTTIRPKSVDSDIFWVDNGCYIKEITFRDHQNGAACLAFDPRVDSPGAGTFITQSPYCQNCTSLTTSGIGLKIDGSKVSGLRSMVLDAFTQFNAGGTGVWLLNRGYAQLVSLFTVSTTTSVLTTTGGQCSLTNSNSSFGERGLVSTGGSPSLYNGTLHANYVQNDDVIRINAITTQDSADYTLNVGDFKKPNYNDAIYFDSDNYYYTVLDVSDEITQDWGITGNTEETVKGSALSSTTYGQYGWATHINQDDTYMAISELNEGAGQVEVLEYDLVGGVPVWTYESVVAPTPPFGILEDSDKFGDTVLFNKDASYIAVASPGKKETTGGGSTRRNGGIYTFRKNGNTWDQDAFVALAEVNDRDRFFGGDGGLDLSEDGLTMAVSSVEDQSAGGQGSVYIYLRTAPESSLWTQQQQLFCPEGVTAIAERPSAQLSEDGTDLLIHWRGNANRIYYYQRNIDNEFILAQVIVPQSNFSGLRYGTLKMNPEAAYFVFGDPNAPRGYFTNEFTVPGQASEVIAKKQKLINATLTGGGVISTTDVDVSFNTDFPVNTQIKIVGAGANDGDYTIIDRTATTLTVSVGFPSPGTFSDVQVYVEGVGVAEMFVFEEGQWITQDIIQPETYPYEYGYGVAPDINTRGELIGIGNRGGSDRQQANKVTMLERARSDWRLVSTIEPQTPTNIVTQGENDLFGAGSQSIAVGGSGDYLAIGAADRREDFASAGTEYGKTFIYYSILDETGSFELTVAPALNRNLRADQNASFHQRSLITASGHTFEYVGSGTNMFTAIPQNGGIPKKENEVIFDSAGAAEPNFGLVYFTATDELGDFRIGEDLTINREEGTITGVTFDRSLFAVLTPFILALEG